MNKAMLTVGIILLSMIALVMINLISNYSTGSELDYYMLKETTESAMGDAVDVAYYRRTGLLRMDKEKFVENFLCRFADTVDNTREYNIGFYDLSEIPPKASVKIDSNTVVAVKGNRAGISTKIDAILETGHKKDYYVKKSLGH